MKWRPNNALEPLRQCPCSLVAAGARLSAHVGQTKRDHDLEPRYVSRHLRLHSSATRACGEDRRLTAVAVAHVNMRQLAPILECHREAFRGYPQTLEQVAWPMGTCSAAHWISEARAESEDLQYASYAYGYNPSGPTAEGRFGRYALLAAGRYDAVECSRCRSFWLDDSGVLRTAPGRRAGRNDEPVE
jgi:hypothetical protein